MKQKISLAFNLKSLSVVFLIGSVFFMATPSFVDSSQTLTNKILKSKAKEKAISEKKNPQADYIEDEIIIKFNPDGNFEAKSKNLAERKGLEKKEIMSGSGIGIFKIKDKKNVSDKIDELKQDEDVLYAQPNYKYKKLAPHVPLDEGFANQWNLNNTGQQVNGGAAGTSDADIDSPEAWEVSMGTENDVIVAIIDDGVAYNHPDLLGNMWDGSSCVDENNVLIEGGCIHGYYYDEYGPEDNDPLPWESSHGTMIAGIIGAIEDGAGAGTGIVGVAPNVKIMAIKTENFTTSEIVKAISFAKNNGANIINASFGDYYEDNVLYDAIADYSGLFVTAAGNDSEDNDNDYDALYPCSFDLENIICVGATDNDDVLSSWSGYGAIAVDVAAPGEDIYSSSAKRTIVNEDFDSNTPPGAVQGWTSTGNFGTVDLGGGDIAAIGDTNQFPYLDSASNTLTSPTYDLSTFIEPTLSFDLTCDTEYDQLGWSDYMLIESSDDGGVTWDEYSMEDETTLDDDVDEAGSATYTFQDGLLSSDAFRMRFTWISDDDGDNNYAGCTINNFKIESISDGAENEFEYSSGTSFSTAQVSGLAGLVAGYLGENLDASIIKNAILTQGDSQASLADTTVSGKRINAYKTLNYLGTSKNIISFGLPLYDVTVDNGNHTVLIEAPYGTDVTNLAPMVVHDGASVSPAAGVAQDFTNPVTYTVTARDASTQEYIVTAVVLPNSAKEITSFSITGISGASSVINENNHTITVTVPYGTNVTNLEPVIVHTGDSISPNSGVVQDFTSPVTYTVTAANNSVKPYVVIVVSAEHPFNSSKVSFEDDLPASGKTNKLEVKLDFKNVENATEYMSSRKADFAGAVWKPIKGGITVKLKKEEDVKQKYYVKFKDAKGIESEVYKKTLIYAKKKRVIKNSSSKVSKNETLVQSGKNFSSNANIDLYFSRPGGGYFPKTTVKTNDKGAFSISYVVNKPSGKYTWYAVDTKSGKKSKESEYTVR